MGRVTRLNNYSSLKTLDSIDTCIALDTHGCLLLDVLIVLQKYKNIKFYGASGYKRQFEDEFNYYYNVILQP